MKKNVLKLLAAVLCLALCFSLAACGSKDSGENASAEGSWKATSVTDAEGTTISGEEIESVLGETGYAFAADGTFTATTLGQNAEGTWTQDGNIVTFEANGITAQGTIEGDTMTLESNGGVSEFARQ